MGMAEVTHKPADCSHADTEPRRIEVTVLADKRTGAPSEHTRKFCCALMAEAWLRSDRKADRGGFGR